MTAATELEIYDLLRSKRRGKVAGRIAVWAAAALCAITLGGLVAAATMGWMAADSAPAAGVMDASL